MESNRTVEEMGKRIDELETLVAKIRKNTNQAIKGHAVVLESLVDHTKYVPASGRRLIFPRVPVDVGEEV